MSENIPDISEVARQDQISRVTLWGSRFKFLSEHCGIRPSRVSYLLGTTGSGKTSLLSPIIADAAKDSPVLVILTEEDVLRYLPSLYKANPQIDVSRLNFVLESEIPKDVRDNQDLLFLWLEATIIEHGCKVIFWDNLTTSAFYSQRFGVRGQENTCLKLRELTSTLGVAFFIVIHTKKDVVDNQGRFIQGEDVRGSQQSFISADHFYILQRFTVGSVYYAYIRTVKHRGYPAIYKDHLLYFNDGIYKSDSRTTFDEVNDIFMKRNVLGKKKESDSKKRRYEYDN